VFEFFLFTPEDRRPVPLALASTVLFFIGTPECLHCENGMVTGRLGNSYVGFMNFICTDKTTRMYSRRARQQSGRIFIDGEEGVSFSRPISFGEIGS